MIWLFSNPPLRIVHFLLGGVSFNKRNLGNKEWTLGSIWWQSMKYPWTDQNYSRSSASSPTTQAETLPDCREILRWQSLPLRWIPVSEWVLGIRSLLLIILLNHLFGLSGLLSHSVFWDIFLMPPTFSILQFWQSEYFSSQTPPANKACSRRIRQIFVQIEISHLPGGLGHLADSNSIPWNPIATYHPIQIAIIRLMSLLLFHVQLVLQFHLSLRDEV